LEGGSRTRRPSNRRYVLDLPGGSSAFAKIAAFDYTGDWLRREHLAYQAFGDETVVPRLLGWHDDGVHPTLILEDLSDARWPAPWGDELIDGVLTALDVVRGCTAPRNAFDMARRRSELTSWPNIADDPSGVLGLGLCTSTWLERAIGPMLEAEAMAPLEGTDTLHMDVRSDDLCLRDHHVVLVDWNWVSVGNGSFDVAAWLPSLESRGPTARNPGSSAARTATRRRGRRDASGPGAPLARRSRRRR
jgi:hypothetical protein